MTTRHCKRCSIPIGPRVTLCEACRVDNAEQAWRQQGTERRSAYQEIDIDAIPRIVGCGERDERYDEDFRAVDMAVSRYLVSVGE